MQYYFPCIGIIEALLALHRYTYPQHTDNHINYTVTAHLKTPLHHRYNRYAMSEDQLQAQCFQDHWNRFPEKRRRLFHINQKARNKIEGNRMKAMGVVPGVSDFAYLLASRREGEPGSVRWIEMKTDDGVQSADQVAFQLLVESLGMEYHICRSLFRFRELTQD